MAAWEKGGEARRNPAIVRVSSVPSFLLGQSLHTYLILKVLGLIEGQTAVIHQCQEGTLPDHGHHRAREGEDLFLEAAFVRQSVGTPDQLTGRRTNIARTTKVSGAKRKEKNGWTMYMQEEEKEER